MVADFFGVAAEFWETAPWEVLSREEILQVQGLGPDPVYLSVLGGEEDEVPGLGVHDDPTRPARAVVAFVGRQQAGDALVREVQENGLPLAHPDALPLAFQPGQEHLAAPSELAALGRCLQVVLRFLQAGLDEREAVEDHTLRLADRSRVRVTWREVDPFADMNPVHSSRFHAAEPPGEAQAPAARPFCHGPRPGRNDPCWCGSGQKYKKCHLEADRQQDSQALRTEASGIKDPG